MIWSLITELAAKLIPIFGNNYSKRNLQHYRKFYILFPDNSKVYEFVHNLNWTHIRRLLSVVNPEARMWYLNNVWSEQNAAHDITYPSIKVRRGSVALKNAHFLSFFYQMVILFLFILERPKKTKKTPKNCLLA